MEELLSAVDALETDLIALESGLVDLRLTGGNARQDTIRWPRRLWAKIASLAGYASGSDHRPTDAMLEVRDIYREQLRDHLTRWRALIDAELRELNRMLVARGLPPVLSAP